MIVFLIALLIVLICQMRFVEHNANYLGKVQTTAIKGFFTCVIFLSHVKGYIQLPIAPGDRIYTLFFAVVGQLMVTVFFFFSGYGIFESYKKKDSYAKTFFKNRFLKTLVNFAFALVLFIIVNAILGIQYPAKSYILCWIGWESIGNSNWFVFDILAVYLMTQFAFLALRKYDGLALAVLTTLLCLCLWGVLCLTKGEDAYWYNTVLCYPLGMWVSFLKERLERHLPLKTKMFWTVLIGTAICFAVIYSIRNGVCFSVAAILFCVLLVLLSMKVKVGNGALWWFGKHTFSVFILQRIPMRILYYLGLNKYRITFTVSSLLLTVLLAFLFDLLVDKFNDAIFNKKTPSADKLIQI